MIYLISSGIIALAIIIYQGGKIVERDSEHY